MRDPLAEPSDLIRSVSRALRVLESVGRAPRGLTVKQIARRCELTVATTYHLVRTLAYEGYVIRREDGTYIVGLEIADRYRELVSAFRGPPAVGEALRRAAVDTGYSHYLGRFVGGRVRIGVSPHAPYTVSGTLYAATAAWAREAGLPIAVHLAESPAESALLADGTGAFADAWRGRGIPMPAPLGCTPVAWLDDHGVLSERTLCIHVVQAGPADVQRLARANAAVAHCPMSNRAHGHGEAPLAALLAAGLRVGLGTDSIMSVGTLDLLAEARAARALAGLDAAEALALCTRDAARALGLETEVGVLAPGRWGDCVVIRARAARGAAPEEMSAEERVLASDPRDVLATFVGGRDVHRTSPAL